MAQKNRFLTFRCENSGEAQFHARFDEQKLESAPEATELEPELLAELSRALQVLEAAQGVRGHERG